jgi:hypothetical protein
MKSVGISPLDQAHQAQGEDMKIKTNIRAGSGTNSGGVNSTSTSTGGGGTGGGGSGGGQATDIIPVFVGYPRCTGA